MVCKSNKRARPSTHLKSVKTRKGKKVVVVNRDVKKKTKRNVRPKPIRSNTGKIRIDRDASKIGFLDSTKVSPKGLDVLSHLEGDKQKDYTKQLSALIDEDASDALKSEFVRISEPYSDQDFRVRRVIKNVLGDVEEKPKEKIQVSDFVKSLSASDLIKEENISADMVYDPELRSYVSRKRSKQ